ncbi:M24 family metallopeptidase [Alteromonas confluentis]|uniref:X-Pro dipeptidase n=1 Tax=Alteromonas confluentis TaxID=1656094 RepID=A0A1E7Z6N1_9ALTE|nr:Xaa-Pro peptidase family protein [Alteromonas confluentis]OFC69186.1 X-Pro dipeptidase [Alteromonas confluentis]
MAVNGIGGKTTAEALSSLKDMTQDISAVGKPEYLSRIASAQAYMQQNDIAAVYLNAGTNMTYFTGLEWYASERLVGAILPANGDIVFIAPTFEIGSLSERQLIEGEIIGWQEHESPYTLFANTLSNMGISEGATIGVDESTAFFIVDGFNKALSGINIINGSAVTAHCRMQKSETELALIQRAMDMTITVHKAAASILREGITTTEVEQFIHEAHKKVGAPAGSYFCIVLFGKATSFPHGVKDPQVLKANDMVLIDTGCKLKGYLSDITRTYCFGTPTEKQATMWEAEKAAQIAAFNAAKTGAPCGDVDAAARACLETYELGPDYNLPGLPHRTGHGIGMDIHEWPYLVKDNPQPLAKGMCFSNEPMIVVPGEFGIRLEDHFYMTDTGAAWFTEPAHSIENPFG